MESIEKKIEAAIERGRFEGEVLGSLKDIKAVLSEMTKKHVLQDAKIDMKVDKSDFKELQKEVASLSRWRYIAMGGGAVIGWILSVLSS